MKKVLKSRIFIFTLTAIIFSGFGVLASQIFARDVSYGNTNVESALDDLYSKAGNIKKSNETLQYNTTNTLTYPFSPNYINIDCSGLVNVAWMSSMLYDNGNYSYKLQAGANSSQMSSGSISVNDKTVSVTLAGYVSGSGSSNCSVLAAKLK